MAGVLKKTAVRKVSLLFLTNTFYKGTSHIEVDLHPEDEQRHPQDVKRYKIRQNNLLPNK
ncbi:hypothetical protein DC415_23945 [Agrobacterium tumefaciens]|uniref:Uncharacterized protein n=1 Tax=Rhizobium rhizogenes TaxID=359 RepID=A0AA92H714_RHIRH|nr:hypothetical protein DC430_23515 [Rhizobium rhizogenes]PVE62004.1 hypothetical protein DC415_23945 [Agrobacterium tumefaciens]PVE69768.1 hypothetical protein DCP16_23945 [Sphingomonas sp. TPD3009]